MKSFKFKGTTIPYGYKGTLEQFTAEHENTRDFRKLLPKDRSVELKKAFNEAKKEPKDEADAK